MTPEEMMRQADRHHRSGHLAEAESLCAKVLSGEPTHPDALHLMGKAAFIAATRHARQHVVMASTDRITFDEPVSVDDLIE